MSTDTKFKSLLQEMSNYTPSKGKEEVIDSRAQHIIASAINLLQSIHESFGAEEAELLEKKFFSSIKGKDTTRFSRQMTKLKESKK